MHCKFRIDMKKMDIISHVKLEILCPSLQIPVQSFACFPPAESSLNPMGTTHPSCVAVWGWGIYSSLSSDPQVGWEQPNQACAAPTLALPTCTAPWCCLSCQRGTSAWRKLSPGLGLMGWALQGMVVYSRKLQCFLSAAGWNSKGTAARGACLQSTALAALASSGFLSSIWHRDLFQN